MAKEVKPEVESATEADVPVENTPFSPEAPAPAVGQSDEALAAIAKGMQAIAEAQNANKNFKIETDDNIQHRFSVVRDKATGTIMTRENDSGKLTPVQLSSLEEKQIESQNAEVEEV
jgi:hypothetical protein|nr:MAG TPA: hypothetical protein [Caudoviricetes sp.]